MNLSKFESGAMRIFWEKYRSGAGASKQGFPPCPSIISNSNSKSLKIAQKTAFEAKGRQHIAGKVVQHLFNIDLYTFLAIYRFR